MSHYQTSMMIKGKCGLLQTPELQAHVGSAERALRGACVIRAWNTAPSDTDAAIHFVPLNKKRAILTVKSDSNVTVLNERIENE